MPLAERRSAELLASAPGYEQDVSTVDQAAESRIVARIRSLFPTQRVLTEETERICEPLGASLAAVLGLMSILLCLCV